MHTLALDPQHPNVAQLRRPRMWHGQIIKLFFPPFIAFLILKNKCIPLTQTQGKHHYTLFCKYSNFKPRRNSGYYGMLSCRRLDNHLQPDNATVAIKGWP